MAMQVVGKSLLWVTSDRVFMSLKVQQCYMKRIQQLTPSGSDDRVHCDYYVLERRKAPEGN